MSAVEDSSFSFDGAPETRPVRCVDCDEEHDSIVGFVLKDGNAHAIYFAEWHERWSEAYLDVILGSFEGPDYEDNVTFGCRVGYVQGQALPACSLVQAAMTRSEAQIFGARLSRDEALVHPRLAELWEVVDWLIVNDPTLHDKVFHMPPADGSTQPGA